MVGLRIMQRILTFQKLRAQRAFRKRQLTDALKEIAQDLKAMGAIKIVVFGSYVSGTIRRWSDLDILAVMPSTKTGKEWFKEIWDKVDSGVSADVLPFTEEELIRKTETSSFIRHAIKTGKVIYEKGSENGGKKLVHPGRSRV